MPLNLKLELSNIAYNRLYQVLAYGLRLLAWKCSEPILTTQEPTWADNSHLNLSTKITIFF